MVHIVLRLIHHAIASYHDQLVDQVVDKVVIDNITCIKIMHFCMKYY